MHVAAQHQRVARRRRGNRVEQFLPRHRIAVPAVDPVAMSTVLALVELGHQRLLREEVPARRGPLHAVGQPRFLLRTQHAARRIEPLGALVDIAALKALGLARVVCAILAVVEREDFREVAEAIAVVEPERRAHRLDLVRERHVLPIGLVGCGAHRQERLGDVIVRRDVVGVVVRHLVIVPRDDPGMPGMGCLQVAIRLIERIAVAIFLERSRATALVTTHQIASPAALVDIVAEEQHRVQFLVGHVALRGIETLLVLLARREGEAQRRHVLGPVGRGARAADRTGLALHGEAIPVEAVGPQPLDIDMHRVAPLRLGGRPARVHDLLHPLVLGDRPADGDRAVEPFGWIGRHQAGPQHDRCRLGPPRGDAEAERIRRQRSSGPGETRHPEAGPQNGGKTLDQGTALHGTNLSRRTRHFNDGGRVC